MSNRIGLFTFIFIIILFIGIAGIFILPKILPSLENNILYQQGYQIINQSQEIELKFEFDPIWLPSKDGEVKKLHKLIYQGHSTKIYLEKITNVMDSENLAVALNIEPDYHAEGGTFVSKLVFQKDGSFQTINLHPDIYDQSGVKLNEFIPTFNGSGNQFGFFVKKENVNNLKGPLLIKYDHYLNLISYKRT